MNVDSADTGVSPIAAAIGEPARARMLYCLMDGNARTSTELATVAAVSTSTASVHLNRLKTQHLVKVLVQGKHRYYSLEGPQVAAVLEALRVLADGSCRPFHRGGCGRLHAARTCYDHMAGRLGVSLHDRFMTLGWLSKPSAGDTAYEVAPEGEKGFKAAGIDVDSARGLRRRVACACLDWSERRPHVGGALGAALLQIALTKRWVEKDLDSRALTVTRLGRRELMARFGVCSEQHDC